MVVVEVGSVVVGVRDQLVMMGVGVLANDPRIMHMIVVTVVVTVRVLVIDRFVHVLVGVSLGEVQVHADPEAGGRGGRR